MKLAIIRDGAAVELAPGADVVFAADLDLSPAAWSAALSYTADERLARGIHVVVEVNAEIGDNQKLGPAVLSFDGETVTARREAVALSAPEIVARKVTLKAYAAQKRWEKEMGGLTLPGGMGIKTDTEARVKIRELKDNIASGKLQAPYRFKATSGWVAISEETLGAVYDAIVAFVDGCFSKEDEVDQAITAGEIKTTAAIDAAFAD